MHLGDRKVARSALEVPGCYVCGGGLQGKRVARQSEGLHWPLFHQLATRLSN